MTETITEPTRLERWETVKRQEQFTLSENVTNFVETMINDANRYERATQSNKSSAEWYSNRLDTLQSTVNQFKDMLNAAVDDGMIGEELFAEWCEHFGFETTKTIEVTANVTVTATLLVPRDFDCDSWADDLTIEMDFGYQVEVDSSDYDIDSTDWNEA